MPPIAPFEIHEDIREAQTLPARVYSDPAIFELQRERVFAPSWQFITDVSHVKVPGQVHPFTQLEGTLDEPLMFARDRDDHLHCMSNVCTHRGHTVCEGEGVENGLRCRYHGRRFGLDGKFQFMPEFEQAKRFPSPADDLPQVPFAAWENFLFASLEPATPFDQATREMRERCAWMPLGQAAFDPSRSREYRVRANRALYCDNFLEGFHIPFVHTGLSEALDYGAYRTELFPGGSLQVGVAGGASSGADVFEIPASSPDHGQSIAAYWFWIYPNTMFNFYPWGVSINVVRPLGVDQTRVSYYSYVWDAARLNRGAGAALDRVEREDEAIVERVQIGTAARLYDRGRYSPTREQGVHHFHRMLARDLGRG
jgi:choline monooxygenase